MNRRLQPGLKLGRITPSADDGKVVFPIGDGVDANAFDPETKLAFASTGDGNLTVAHEDGPDKYTVVAIVPTKKSAHTVGLDLKLRKIFLPLFARAWSQEKKIERKDLPPAVEVAAESVQAEIRGFSVEKKKGKTYYEMQLAVNGHGVFKGIAFRSGRPCIPTWTTVKMFQITFVTPRLAVCPRGAG